MKIDKRIIITVLIISTITVGAIIYTMINAKNEQKGVVLYTQEKIKNAITIENEELPIANTSNPYMLDFKDGTNGLHTELRPNQYGNHFTIALKKDSYDNSYATLWISRTNNIQRETLPLSTAPSKIVATGEMWNEVKEALKNIDSKYKTSENDYEFIIINAESGLTTFNKKNYFKSIALDDIKFNDGKYTAKDRILTEWLKGRQYWLDYYESSYGFIYEKLDSPFFARFNIMEQVQFGDENGNSTFATVVGENLFDYNKNGYTLEELESFMKSNYNYTMKGK